MLRSIDGQSTYDLLLAFLSRIVSEISRYWYKIAIFIPSVH